MHPDKLDESASNWSGWKAHRQTGENLLDEGKVNRPLVSGRFPAMIADHDRTIERVNGLAQSQKAAACLEKGGGYNLRLISS